MELTPGAWKRIAPAVGLSVMLTDTTDLSAGQTAGPPKFRRAKPCGRPARGAAPTRLTARLRTVRLAGYKTSSPMTETDRHRALMVLASCADGLTEALLTAGHHFTRARRLDPRWACERAHRAPCGEWWTADLPHVGRATANPPD